MNDILITQQVKKKKKKHSKLIARTMIAATVIIIIFAIMFDAQGMLFPAFLLAMFYFYYTMNVDVEYEYNFENEMFSVDVIKGKRRRKTEQALYYKNIEVVAPPDHSSVLKYKKNGGTEKIKKYDYTSYEDDIPYYTMIVTRNQEKIKLLLDLNEETLRFLKLRYPTKVFLQ